MELNETAVKAPEDSLIATPPAPVHAAAAHKWLIALAVMLGTTLEVLDTSIKVSRCPTCRGRFRRVSMKSPGY
jgi:hypothetical protein